MEEDIKAFSMSTATTATVLTVSKSWLGGKGLGYQYIGIIDHSQSAFYAHGLNKDGILRQHEEIDRLNSNLGDFKILKGIEVDILSDGSLDYADDLLASFDFVIAAVHSGFSMDQEEMTGGLLMLWTTPIPPCWRILQADSFFPVRNTR